MRVEVERFSNGNLKLKIVFEPSSNFWLHYDPKRNIWYASWVSTEEQIITTFLSYLGIDGVNKQLKEYRRNNRYRG